MHAITASTMHIRTMGIIVPQWYALKMSGAGFATLEGVESERHRVAVWLLYCQEYTYSAEALKAIVASKHWLQAIILKEIILKF